MELSANVIGFAAAIFTATSMVPQLIKIIKTKKSEGISLFMIFILITGLLLWIWYGFKKNDLPVISTNIFSVFINVLIIYFHLKYKNTTKEQP